MASEEGETVTIRVRVTNGVLVPLEPLPADFGEGQEVDLSPKATSTTNGALTESELGDDLADGQWLSDEEAASLQAILDENRRLGKEHMRTIMGFPK